MADLVSAKKFFRPNVTKLVFLTAAADYTALTRAEIDAGTVLTVPAGVFDADGWDVTGGSIDTPDASTRFTSKIPGRITTGEPTLSFYASSDGDDISTVLPRDTEGFMVWMDGGDVTTEETSKKMDVFPVRVSSNSAGRSLSADQAAPRVVTFTITAEPSEGQTVPAAA